MNLPVSVVKGEYPKPDESRGSTPMNSRVPSAPDDAESLVPVAHESHRQRLLELRRQQQSARSTAIPRRAESSTAVLSSAQEGLWFVDELTGPSGLFNIAQAMRLRGPLNVVALERSLRAVVERHEILRTEFEQRNGVPVQIVRSMDEVSGSLKLEPLELVGATAIERERALDKWLRACAAEPFDLSRAPLLRAQLRRIDEGEFVLLLVIHHIVCDGWSVGIIERELGALYAAFCAGLPSPLVALPIRFADYAIWQRERIQSEAAQDDMNYWLGQLKGLDALELPTDRARAARLDHKGASLCFEIAPTLVCELKALALRENVTLFMLLLAALQVLLMRYSGQDDVVVGSPVAGRNRTVLEGLVGHFVNTLVLRGDLSGSPSFIELLGRVRRVCLDAYAHQELPFDRLVALTSPQRDLGRHPLYQVAFALQNVPSSTLTLVGVRVERLGMDASAARLDLSVSLTERNGTLDGLLEYSTRLFDCATVERIALHYQQLLSSIAFDPERSIARLSLVSDSELARTFRAWNNTARAYDRRRTIHELFQAQARRSPLADAVVCGAQRLTYAELQARSNRLTSELRAQGVGRGMRVGLCVARTPNMVVAQLAILQSGAAYVPLDPTYPAQRLTEMVTDADLVLLVTESAVVGMLSWPISRVLVVDHASMASWSDLATLPDLQLDTQADDPAYVLYTSGSTGRPKGVVVSHRAVVNFLTSMALEPGMTAADRWLAVTTLSFDISVLELLLPLTVGAQVILSSLEQSQHGPSLRALLESSGATGMQATPATWRMLVEAGWSGSAEFKALIGGESLPLDLSLLLLARTGELWNMYGPTETTVWSTCWRVREPERGIVIGRPIANTTVWVVDEQMEICPVGVPGEILIGGDGVAVSYLNRPELTAERFVTDSFGGAAGARLYRTGDRGRWRSDGTIEHLGRLDNQIKLRGHRIEPGEIEALLAAHPGIAHALVAVRECGPGDARLVAYVVPRQAMQSYDELRAYLRDRLPAYMLPQHFVAIESVPTLPNGKIDWRSLPPLHLATQVGDQRVTEPSTHHEAEIAAVWRELLGIDSIGVTDNFFDLGGHSLLAMRAIAEIERRTGYRASPQSFIFENLAQLAGHADARPNVALPSAGGNLASRLAAVARRLRRNLGTPK